MKKRVLLVALLCSIGFAQNAAVSSYLDPRTSGYADVRIREVRIPSSGYAIDTYWCTLGYRTSGSTTGYGGLQWTSDYRVGPKNYIYSQWNDYSKNAYNDPATQVMTFGGEGTGVKSINNDAQNQWKPDYWHVTADRVWNKGSNTHFAYIVKNGETGVWRHIMTWDTPERNLKLTGSYCFLEDWWETGEYRESHIRKGWNRLSSNESWQPITTYNYSINTDDIQPRKRSYYKRFNWRGGKKHDATGEFFYMGAGGNVSSTNNSGTDYSIARSETSPQDEYGVLKIDTLMVKPILNNSGLVVNWKNDRKTVPQFAYYLSIKESGVNSTQSLVFKSDTIPQKRSDTLDISSLSPKTKNYTVTLNILDMFDGEAIEKSVTFGDEQTGISNGNSLNSSANKLNLTLSGRTISFNRNFNTPLQFSLYTVTGRVILKETVSERVHQLSQQISQGSYIWKASNSVVSGKGAFTTIR